MITFSKHLILISAPIEEANLPFAQRLKILINEEIKASIPKNIGTIKNNISLFDIPRKMMNLFSSTLSGFKRILKNGITAVKVNIYIIPEIFIKINR